MKKIVLLTSLLLAFLLVACGSETAETTTAPIEPTAAPESEAPVESIPLDMQMLTGTTWAWMAFTDPTQQFVVDAPQNYTLDFQADGSLVVVADCNNAMGTYTIDGSSLSIAMGPMTMAACPPGSLSDDFVRYLGSAAIFFFEEGKLFIDLTADGGTMTFAPADNIMADDGEGAIDGALTANPWHWVAFTDPAQQFDVDDPVSYTLTFQEDGTVNIQAYCNSAIGSYMQDGSSISIEVGPMTMAACPPGSLSDDFVKYLGFAAIYFFEESDLFIDLMADGGTMRLSPHAGSAEAGEFNPDAEPLFATLVLGGGETLWLDPTLVSVRSGTLEGPGVDATTLGGACTGIIPSQPDVIFNWEEHEGLQTLNVFTLSMGDPTLVLVTPSGEVLCSDDFNPLVLDPFIEIKDPQVGRYAAFIGSFENDAVEPGFLVVTSHELNPANMDLSQMFPRHIDPRANSETISLDVLEIDSPDAVEPAGGSLTPEDLPYQQELTGGGEIGAFNLDHENQLCTGFISAAPTFRFEWSGDLDQFQLFFESNVDTTLKVLDPEGSFHCDDDYHGSENLNPWLALPPITGTYNVWVGSFAPDVQASGTLTITSDPDATPTPLTSQDLQQ
jgi:heat shock protein HslJ